MGESAGWRRSRWETGRIKDPTRVMVRWFIAFRLFLKIGVVFGGLRGFNFNGRK